MLIPQEDKQPGHPYGDRFRLAFTRELWDRMSVPPFHCEPLPRETFAHIAFGVGGALCRKSLSSNSLYKIDVLITYHNCC